jgi:5-hydroxyisourate hydrolase-like protein (transthyretin family)
MNATQDLAGGMVRNFVRIILVAFGLTGLAGLTVNASVAQTASGSASGHVLCDDGDVPARGAHVQLVPLNDLLPKGDKSKDGAQATETTTDFFGDYDLYSVAPGTYVVTAGMSGYSDDFGLTRKLLPRFNADEQKRLLALFPQVTVRAGGEARQDVVLHRAGAISGQVTVDIGGTVPASSTVTATLVSGRLIGKAADAQHPLEFSQTAEVDDRGMYRIVGLPPGEYKVSIRETENFFDAKVVNGNVEMHPQGPGLADLQVWAPNATNDASARLIKVAEGTEADGGDIVIPTQKLHTIRGIVTQNGAPAAGISVQVLSAAAGNNRLMTSDALTGPDGSYRFDLLPDGMYVVRAARYSHFGPTAALKQKRDATVALNGADRDGANIDLR